MRPFLMENGIPKENEAVTKVLLHPGDNEMHSAAEISNGIPSSSQHSALR